MFITTKNGYGLKYSVDEVSEVGLRASGVKAISLKNDIVITGHVYDSEMEFLTVVTNKGTGKRIRLSEFEQMSRARKGVLMVRDVKTNPYSIVKTFILPSKNVVLVKIGNDYQDTKITELPITDRYSTGTQITKSEIAEAYVKEDLEKETKPSEQKEVVKEEEKEEVNLEKIDEKILTIDDFLDDFKF